MRKFYWLPALMAIFLAATLTWAELGFAQGQGPGRGAAAQSAGPGWGTGNPNCPYYTGSQTRPQYGGGQIRARKRLRQNVLQAPAVTPQTQTPSSQSGN